MIFRRWSHGHNIGTGVLGGLLLSEHGWTVAVLAFTLGLVAGSFAHLLRGLGERLRRPKTFDARRCTCKLGDGRCLNGYCEVVGNTAGGLRPVPNVDVESMARVTYPTTSPGVRVDAQGREYYSAAWLSDGAA